MEAKNVFSALLLLLSSDQEKRLNCAISYFHEKTCIVLRPKRESDYNYVDIRMSSRGGCYSVTLGKNGGRHEINLAYPACWRVGTIVHEIMHAIGFFHEQSRNDRDQYITVHWNNIPNRWRAQFNTGKQMGVDRKKEVLPTTNPGISSNQIYQGCFESPKLRCEYLPSNSPYQCYQRCRNTYPIMTSSGIINSYGLRDKYCCCYPASYLLKEKKKKSKDCNIRCPGDSSHNCGGYSKFSNDCSWAITAYSFGNPGFCPQGLSVYVSDGGKILRGKNCNEIRCKQGWSCFQNNVVAACCPIKYHKSTSFMALRSLFKPLKDIFFNENNRSGKVLFNES